MAADFISYNGAVTEWGAEGVPLPGELAGGGFVYRKLHVLDGRILGGDEQSGLAAVSCRGLYGCAAGLEAGAIGKETAALLHANRYSGGSVEVMLCLLPPQDNEVTARRLMLCTRRLLYDGLVYWHATVDALTMRYDVPWPEHKTGASLSTHALARETAGRKGFDMAVAVDRAGSITGVGEWPVFALTGREAFTPPLTDGLPDSIERRLGIETCRRAGLTVCERSILAIRLKACDELFFFTTQGIVSIGRLDDRLYTHTAARRAELFIPK